MSKKSIYKVVATNRKAKHEYFILDTYEAGMVLVGVEVKVIRESKASIAGSFAIVDKSEVWLIGTHVPLPESKGLPQNFDPYRKRKLLLHKSEIRKLQSELTKKGTTLIPLEMFISEKGLVKILLGVAQGKKEYDKRDTIKAKEDQKRIRATFRR